MVFCVERTCTVECDSEGNCTEKCVDLYVPSGDDTDDLTLSLVQDAATLTMDRLSLTSTPDYLVLDSGLDTLAVPVERSGTAALVPSEAWSDVLVSIKSGAAASWVDPTSGREYAVTAYRSGGSYKLYTGRTFLGVLQAD